MRTKIQLCIIKTPQCKSIDPHRACVPPEPHTGKGQRSLSSLRRRKFFLLQIKILPCGCEFIRKPAPNGHLINDDWEQSIISFGYKGSSNWFKMADFPLEWTFPESMIIFLGEKWRGVVGWSGPTFPGSKGKYSAARGSTTYTFLHAPRRDGGLKCSSSKCTGFMESITLYGL